MEQIREESVAKLSEIFQKRTIPLLNENDDPENRNRDNKKDMNDIINKITKLRIEQRVYKMKTNKQIDEELVKWKIEKIQSLRNIFQSVRNIHFLIQTILIKPTKNQAVPDSFQAFHIMKQAKPSSIKGQEDQQKMRTFLDSRVTRLKEVKEKIEKAKKNFTDYSLKCDSTLKALKNVKKTLDFDYAENADFFRLSTKATEVQHDPKKPKQIIVFYRASKNFPNSNFYRSLVKINITPMKELEYEFSTLEEEKLKDLYDKTFTISLSLKKKNQIKCLSSFQLGALNTSKKINEIEFKVLNMQLFNYLLQITSFGKVVPFEFKHSKSDLEIDCKNCLSLELAYRKKEEIREVGRENNNFMIYLMLLWLANNSFYKNVKVNIQEIFGFLGNYLRLKKKFNKWKEFFPGFFFVEQLNPKNLEVLIEAYFNYNKETSFSVYKKIPVTPKKLFIIIRGSKVFTIHPSTGYLNEITLQNLIKEEFKNKFWIHLNH